MRILIDLGHPAHIHYFKNVVSIMQSKGHEFAFVARDKEVLHMLLNQYQINYVPRGKGGRTLIGKLFYILKADFIIYKLARKFKPDVFLSFASTYAAHVSKTMGKPHIVLDDTEHAKFELYMYPPFSTVIINPKSFWKKFSEKQLYLDTFFELNYLHPKYFSPKEDTLKLYQIFVGEVYFILRFVSWNASHDVGSKGLSYLAKMNLVEELSKKGRVFISAEGDLPESLEKYRLKINPVHLHDLLAFASLYVGEGATTASECVTLGVPAIYVNPLNAGTLQEQSEKYGLISLRSEKELKSAFQNIIEDIALTKEKMLNLRKELLQTKIDGTSFLIWFLENYPQSHDIIRNTPEYQYKFK